MSAKAASSRFECLECGFQTLKFFGKCPQCGEWNSLIECRDPAPEATVLPSSNRPVPLKSIEDQARERISTGMSEFDRVLGGGLIRQSLVLIGGEPGVGKSTLLIETAAHLARNGRVLYVSGEESPGQIRSRLDRLGLDAGDIQLLTMATVDDVKSAVAEIKPHLLIIDSIQTIGGRENTWSKGSVGTMRQITAELIELTKQSDLTTFIVGHITKEGLLAGPKTLEHMVDTVLYFQGDPQSDLRILQAAKNRFGSVNEIGVFQMLGSGLKSVQDPSGHFIHQRRKSEPGTTIFPSIQGQRPLLMEIQALVTESPLGGNPRRNCVGYDPARLAMLVSIIEKKLHIPYYKHDIFLNITSGLMLKEPASDLAVAAVLISSNLGISLPSDLVLLGELGLTGEIRPLTFLERRVSESCRHGFSSILIPNFQIQEQKAEQKNVRGIEHIRELLQLIKAQRKPGK